MATARCLVLLAIACFIAPSSAQDGAALNCSVACNNCTKLCDNCTISESCCIECCQEAEACFLPYKRTPITAAAIVGIVILAIAYLGNVYAVVVYVRQTSMPMYEEEWKKYAPIGMAVIALLMFVMAWVIICVVTRQVQGVLGFMKPKLEFIDKFKSKFKGGKTEDEKEMNSTLK